MAHKTLSKTFSTFTHFTKLSIVLRLLFGPVIFLSPVIATVGNVLLDGFDGELYKQSGYARPQYSIYDKILDYYWYVWILMFILLTDVPLKYIFVGLFLYRTLGQLLFIRFNKGIILFLFPNIFEKFFFYYLFANIIGQDNIFMHQSLIMPILLFITIISIALEYSIHLKRINLSGIYLRKKTFWPTKTINPYKAFIVISLFLSMTVILNQFVSTKSTQSLTTKAAKAVKNGKIILYSREGSLSGILFSSNTNTVEAYLFATPEFKKSICHKQIQLTKLRNGFAFTMTNPCLKELPDGPYWLLLTNVGVENQIGSIIEFTIQNQTLIP
jgi:hypothetical protein